MEGKPISSVNCLREILNNELYNMIYMKESDYVVKFMSTHSSLFYYPGEKENVRVVGDKTYQFKYPKPFSDHYKY